MNYWETQEAQQELYAKAMKDSGISWHVEYLKLKAKYNELKDKYNAEVSPDETNTVIELN